MRVFSEDTYGIPPDQTIGSIGEVKYEWVDGQPKLVKLPSVAFIDDKEGKPVAIHRHIGRRPIACFGNSDGDKAMLEWTTVGHSPSLGLIVHHTDADREYAYDSAPKSSGRLIEALQEAPERGWVVVDMAKDWNRIWSEPSSASSATALLQTAWLVEDIAGRGVIDNAQTTIEFGDADAVSGSTCVNRFSGQAKINAPSLRLGPLATTRRAGPPAMMDQEAKFLTAVDQVRSFRVDENGLLYLLDENGVAVLRLSRMEAKAKP